MFELLKALVHFAKWSLTESNNDTTYIAPKTEHEVVDPMFDFYEFRNFEKTQRYALNVTPPEGFSGEIVLPEFHNGLPVPSVYLKNDETMSISVVKIPKGTSRFGSKRQVRVEIDPENPYLVSDGKALYSRLLSYEAPKYLEMYFPSNAERFEVPNGVKIITNEAFAMSKDLREVVLSESVEEIWREAFSESGIKRINLENVRTLDRDVFRSCKNLDNIRLTCEEIPESAFGDCSSLRSVTLENTKIISHCAFDGTAIERLRLPPTIDKIKSILNIKTIEVTMAENSTIFSGGGDEFELKEGTRVVILFGDGEVLSEAKAYDKHILRYCGYDLPLGFDFAKFDEDILKGSKSFDLHKYRAALFRVEHPYEPPANGITKLTERFAVRYVEALIESGETAELSEFKLFDRLTGEEFMRLIKETSSAGKPEITALLLQKQREFGKYGANMGDDEDF